MSKNMVFLLNLVTVFLLYDFLFNVTCLFPEQCLFLCMLSQLFYTVML